ncbi:MAG: amidase family protein, partial [Gemmatimonadaceae bacterium]
MKPWIADASSLADAIRAGDIRSAEALEASLDAIARSDLNAVVYLDAAAARQAAADLDQRISRGEDPGLLAGVPVLIKDLEDVAGMPTTHGSIVFKDNIPPADSTHTARVR